MHTRLQPLHSYRDWRTGNATAKYWVLRLVLEEVHVGVSEFRPSTVDSAARPYLFAQGYLTGTTRKVLLINKQNANATVSLAGAVSARVVDERSHQNPPREETGLRNTITLGPFATAIVVVGST